MKKILIVSPESKIELDLNWFEYWIIKRAFKQRRFSFSHDKQLLKGQRYNAVIVDEVVKFK